MGYMHIENLYKAQEILLFRECFALEKVHGTSAHLLYKEGTLRFFAGGESHERFVTLFDEQNMKTKFGAMGHSEVTVYGEAYGGKCQGMRETYGADLRFIVFDVLVADLWLAVPQMTECAESMGLEVVPWRKIGTDLPTLDAARDEPSEVAVRRGCGPGRPREGIVLRPPIEVRKNNGERIIAKHKGEAFAERGSPPPVIDPAKLAVLSRANEIADEWVTEMRLSHVLDKLPAGIGVEGTRQVIAAMVEDVEREAKGEIVTSKDARAAVGRKTAELFHARLKSALRGGGL